MNGPIRRDSLIRSYGLGVVVAVVAAMLHWLVRPLVDERIPFVFFLPALALVAAAVGRGPAVLVLVAGALNLALSAHPSGEFRLSIPGDRAALAIYCAWGIFLVWYGGRLRSTSTRVEQAEGRLALAQEGTGVGVFELDFENDTAFVSASLCEVLGVPVVQGSVPLDRWLGSLNPGHLQETRNAIAARIARGELRYEREQRIDLPNGGARWVLNRVTLTLGPTGALAQARGTSVDITSRKRVELELQALNLTLEQQVRDRTRERDRTWNNAQDLLLVVSTSGVFEATNPAWGTVLGYRPDQLIGHGHLEFIHPDDRPASVDTLARAGVGTLRRFENRYRHVDGSYRWISWMATPEDDSIYASGRDVTAEKEAAAHLALAQDQLRQSQKMEAVGQLTGGVAHDFNNLLQVISGNLQMLDRHIDGQAASRRYLNNALAATQRGGKLASQLLAFSRRQPLQPRVIHLGRFIAGMDDLLRQALGGGVALELQVDPNLWNNFIDPVQTENALLNLAINARDAMERSGRLTIAVDNTIVDVRTAHAGIDLKPGDYVRVAVRDTGRGMTPEVLAQVFEPFFSTKAPGEGTGLGLSMVHGFVHQSGGHVAITSEVGCGTTVELWLPRSDIDEESVEDSTSDAPRGSQETVLVAEDDDGVRGTVVEMLRDLGYRVVTANDAREALTVIESGAPIDLLFTDVVMPGPLKSVDLAKAARSREPRLAVLFTSGYAASAIDQHGRLDGGVELLVKPYTREQLARKLRGVFSNR
jgi:PAS domain S-box-containing protein